ncbi:hypothetical protein GGI15_001613 [Coemansia interrupta]|uniref:Uncharacterized protein n=1 Tax=Coemansia interrupta TaxID=1126814 RepID=A0A9W8LNG7_9FUNG|nr:hypothetical protein GGI15_001613 [Coemansia interrupta]
MQLFLILFDMLKAAIDSSALLATSHRASSKLFTSTTIFSAVPLTATFGVPLRIFPLPDDKEGNFGKAITYILGTLLVLTAALVRSQGLLIHRDPRGDNPEPAHFTRTASNETADVTIVETATTFVAASQTKRSSEQSDEPAELSLDNHALLSAVITEAPSRAEHHDRDTALVADSVADIVEAHVQINHKGKQSDGQVESAEIPPEATFASTSAAPVKVEHGDGGGKSVADPVACTSGALAPIESGNEESDEEQPTVEQVEEPIKRRRPIRRGGKGKKKKLIQPEETPEVAAPEVETPPVVTPEVETSQVEAPPKTPRKTRRAGRIITNKKLLGVLPTLSPE